MDSSGTARARRRGAQAVVIVAFVICGALLLSRSEMPVAESKTRSMSEPIVDASAVTLPFEARIPSREPSRDGEPQQPIPPVGGTVVVSVEDDECRSGRCPVVGAKISAECEANPSEFTFAVTAADGTATLVLPEGRCEIDARLGLRSSASENVSAPRIGTERVTLKLPVGKRLAGIVVDDLGAPIQGLEVAIAPVLPLSGAVPTGASGIYALVRATSGQDGRFTFDGLPLHMKRWAVEAGTHLLITKVREDLVIRVIRVTGKATIVMRLLVDGVPETSFEINGTSIEAPDGRARIEESPGVRSLHLTGDFAALTREVSLAPGRITDLGDVEAHRGGSIHLAIREGTKPAEGAEILIRGSALAAHTADEEGAALIEQLSPGRYTIAVWGSRGVVPPFDVQVKNGERAELRLATREGATLRGRTLNPTGGVWEQGGVPLICDGFPVGGAADETGRFELRGLLPGRCVSRYEYYVFADGSTDVFLTAGRTTQVDIQFRPDLAPH